MLQGQNIIVLVLRELSGWPSKTFKSASAKPLQLWENPSGPVQTKTLIDLDKKWTWLGIASDIQWRLVCKANITLNQLIPFLLLYTRLRWSSVRKNKTKTFNTEIRQTSEARAKIPPFQVIDTMVLCWKNNQWCMKWCSPDDTGESCC